MTRFRFGKRFASQDHIKVDVTEDAQFFVSTEVEACEDWLLREPIQCLPRAEKIFRDVKRGTLLERRLFGHRFVCDVSRAGPQKLLYLIGERYVSEANLVRPLLAPGMKVVDVGANVGYYTLMFAQVVGPGGRIIAIEPSPCYNLPELKLNIERNELRNVEIVSKAVGNFRGEVGLRAGINSGVVFDETAVL